VAGVEKAEADFASEVMRLMRQVPHDVKLVVAREGDADKCQAIILAAIDTALRTVSALLTAQIDRRSSTEQ
jgi:predicted membrane GTPase involved in stress response